MDRTLWYLVRAQRSRVFLHTKLSEDSATGQAEGRHAELRWRRERIHRATSNHSRTTFGFMRHSPIEHASQPQRWGTIGRIPESPRRRSLTSWPWHRFQEFGPCI